MLRADALAPEAHRLGGRQLHRAARTRRQALRGKAAGQPAPHQTHELLAQPLLRDACLAQRAAGRAAVLAQKPQQDMLAADVAVPQLQRRLLRQTQDLLRARGKFPFCHILHTPKRIFPRPTGF